MTDTAQERRALAGRLEQAGVLISSPWRAAVEAVPRELFLNPGVFLPTRDGRWQPVTAAGSDPAEW
ncbi:methyltransferase, partial [Streptomyces sp. SID7982]|nr:methyltransferase [Streptomyces sp. SID7982]